MNEKLKSESVDQLFKGILELQTIDECYSFFEDLCTIGELVSMSQRFEVAKMLKEGQTYLAISAKTGASTATISRADEQCQALYGCTKEDVLQFPPSGLDAGDSFIAKENKKKTAAWAWVLASPVLGGIALIYFLVWGRKKDEEE